MLTTACSLNEMAPLAPRRRKLYDAVTITRLPIARYFAGWRRSARNELAAEFGDVIHRHSVGKVTAEEDVNRQFSQRGTRLSACSTAEGAARTVLRVTS